MNADAFFFVCDSFYLCLRQPTFWTHCAFSSLDQKDLAVGDVDRQQLLGRKTAQQVQKAKWKDERI